MPLYKQDPNDSKKQVPDGQGDNRHDQISSATAFTKTKTPNYIIVNTTISNGLGFHFNPTEFATSATSEGTSDNVYSGSTGYDKFDGLVAGQYNFHPIAVSGSAADVAKIKFVYKSGLATGGF